MRRGLILAFLVFFPLWAEKLPLAVFHGTLKTITPRQVTVIAGEDQLLVFHRVKKTRFLLGDKEVGEDQVPLKSQVTVEAKPTPWGDPDAINVIVETKVRTPQTPKP